MIELDDRDARDILIYAFRYTLNRATYSVSTTSTIIKNNAKNLSDADIALYVREISKAIEDKMCGMDMDCQVWKHTAEFLLLEAQRRLDER